MSKSLLLYFIVAAGLILLAACGDDSGTPPATVETPVPATETPADVPATEGDCEDASLTEDAREQLPGIEAAGGRIAFVCEGQIWTMRPDGSDHLRVTEATSVDYDRVRLFRVPEDEPPTEEERQDLESQMNARPLWIPDGRIVFASIRDTLALSTGADPETPRPFVHASELYLVNEDGSGLQRLTDYNLRLGSYPLSSFEPAACDPNLCFAGLLTLRPQAASPNGDQIAVGVTETRFSECCGFAAVLDLNTGAIEKVALVPAGPEGGAVLRMSWSPAGDQAVVHYFRGSPLGSGPYFEELAIRDLAGDSESPVIRFGRGEPLSSGIGGMTWSPARDQIAFCARTSFDEPMTVYVMDASGGEPSALQEVPSPEGTVGSLCSPSWSPTGQFVAVVFEGGQILVLDVATGAAAEIARGSQPAWSGAGVN